MRWLLHSCLDRTVPADRVTVFVLWENAVRNLDFGMFICFYRISYFRMRTAFSHAIAIVTVGITVAPHLSSAELVVSQVTVVVRREEDNRLLGL